MIRYDEGKSSLLILEVVGTPGMEEFRRIARTPGFGRNFRRRRIVGFVPGETGARSPLDQLDEFIAGLGPMCTKHTAGTHYKAAVYRHCADAEYRTDARMLEALTPEGKHAHKDF